MLYVVTGFPRSGTSMMMRCLSFAGIKPVVSELRELAMSHRNKGDYPANPHGFYEVEEREYMRVGFLDSIKDGRCIKLLTTSLPFIPARPATVIWMRRDPTEIRRSYERTFPKESFETRYPDWPRTHDVQLKHIRPIVEDRRSVRLVEINYRDVIENPVRALSVLPIDYQKAAAAVDRSLYRNRAA
jgi:hypothetical protein